MQGFVGSAKASIDSVDAACEQVGSSRRLQGVLRAVLAVGNALNTGTARASADGVKLDSLMKLADVKVLTLLPCPMMGTAAQPAVVAHHALACLSSRCVRLAFCCNA